MAEARVAKEKVKEMLAGHGAVNGIGITLSDGNYAVSVSLRRALAEGEAVPEQVDGVEIRTSVVGEVRKLAD